MSLKELIQSIIDYYKKKYGKPDTEPVKPTPTPVKPVPVTPTPTTGETARYHGRFNGDRPTWYFSKNIKDYPRTIILNVPGCVSDLKIEHNGVRYDKGGIILKQSDVSGRGMALVLPASCKSTQASIKF